MASQSDKPTVCAPDPVPVDLVGSGPINPDPPPKISSTILHLLDEVGVRGLVVILPDQRRHHLKLVDNVLILGPAES